MNSLQSQMTQFEENFWNELKKELKKEYNIDIDSNLQLENSLNFNNSNFLNALMDVLYKQTTPMKKVLYKILSNYLPKELNFEKIVTFDEFSSLIDHIIDILVNN